MTELPRYARVVIIGGGVAGCSIAYHLTLMGWSDVALLERSELTSGSTFHSAGLVGQLRTSVNLTRLIRYSTDLYRRLKAETGQDPEWHEVGSLRLASSSERLEELKRLVALSRSFGLPLELITTQEAKKLFPLIAPNGVLGAVYLPTDGFVDPTGLTMALAAGARARGARFETQTRVLRIETKDNAVSQVVTDRGTIKTETVVNAAGQWAGEIAGLVGLRLPVIPMAHLYLVTRPIDGLPRGMPTLRDPDLLVYFREEVGGLIAGGYERSPAPWGLEGIPEDFNGKLLPPDWERFSPLLENAVRRIPTLESAEVSTLVNGPEGFTPDGEFLLGPTDVRGFWVAAAFCAHGLAGAGGVGKAMAEWIIEGHPEWDLWRLDLRRFGSNYHNQSYALARTIETYSKYYDIHYPNEERSSARPLLLSPAYPRLKDLGAVFGEKAGWERPNWFAIHEGRAAHGHEPEGWARHHWSPAIGVEHLATRQRAGLFDETSFGKMEICGTGAAAFLQALCANDIEKPVGSITYTSMLNDRGGIECDLTVTRLGPDHFFLITGSAFGTHDLSWIRMHLPVDGSVTAVDATRSYACFGLWGPRARAILQKITDADLTNEGFPYMSVRRILVGDVSVVAMRVTYVGELGWEFYCAMEDGLRLWDAIWEAGEPEGLVSAGYRAIDTLRLEKGYRYWSVDIGPDYTPLEAGLAFAVRLQKGDFLGREALLAQKQMGIRRRLCCLTLDGDTSVAIGNEPIRRHGRDEVLGWVTSGGYGYSVERSIAYGYLPVEFSDAGTELDVEIMGQRIRARVVREPLWDPKGERIRT